MLKRISSDCERGVGGETCGNRVPWRTHIYFSVVTVEQQFPILFKIIMGGREGGEFVWSFLFMSAYKKVRETINMLRWNFFLLFFGNILIICRTLISTLVALISAIASGSKDILKYLLMFLTSINIENKGSGSAVRVDFHLFLTQDTCSLSLPHPSSCLSVSFVSIRDSVLLDLIGLTSPLIESQLETGHPDSSRQAGRPTDQEKSFQVAKTEQQWQSEWQA